MSRTRTLWSPDAAPDPRMIAYTAGGDRATDARLLRWDILGSLGHVEALVRGGVISGRDAVRMRRALRAALAAARTGRLTIGNEHEDVHSAVEFWLTRRFGDIGERIHTGRSRNDQVAVDVRLLLKHEVLALHDQALAVADALLRFGRRHRRALWPGYTHQRAAMPSSAGVWAAGYAEALIDAAKSVVGFWPQLDRSPLGSAAGYGVPLPLDREAAARALGFAAIDRVVTTTQATRGQLESQVLAWCLGIARPCARLSSDVILFSADEFGWIVLPPAWSTGSSIMPQKRNPDLFELTRGRAALIEGDLAAVQALQAGLGGGYHRDFQLLKAPLWRGVDTTRDIQGVLAAVIPALSVDAARASRAMQGPILATDEVMRRVRAGVPFRRAYRQVADDVKRGVPMPAIPASQLIAARRGPGGIGAIPFAELGAEIRAARRWSGAARRHFERALDALAGVRRRRR